MSEVVLRLRANPLVTYFSQFHYNARLFLLATVINGVTFSGFQLFFNIYLESRGFSRDFMGVLNSLPSMAMLIGGLPLGVLSDRLGQRRSMLIGIFGSTLAAAWLVTADAEGVMVLMSLVMGAANGLFILSQAPFMMESSSPRERTLLFSLQFGLITLSGAAGNLLAGYLPAWFALRLNVGPESALAYQAVLAASVWVGALSLVPLWFIREGRWPDQESHIHLNFDFIRKLFSPTVMRLALPNLIIGCGAAALIPYLTLYFKTQYRISDNELGWLYSLLSITTGVATIIGPRIAHRLGSKVRAVVFMQGTSLLFFLLVGFAPWYWVAGIAFLLRGAMMNMANPLYSAFAMEQIPKEERGAVNSVMHLTWDFGWATVPYFSGLVQRYYGFTPLFITTITLYSIAVALTWFFWRTHQSETA